MHEIFIDGASLGNPGPAGVGAVILREDGSALCEISRSIGHATNNIAEYLALVYALLEAQRLGCREVAVKTDSELLERQINGRYKVRDVHLRLFFDMVTYLTGTFADFKIAHVPRALNERADRLAGLAAKSAAREISEKALKK